MLTAQRSDLAHGKRELTVLVCTKLPRDAELTRECLAEAGVEARVCRDLETLFEAMDAGAGALLLGEERLDAEMVRRLRDYLDRQPAWSDLPIVVMVSASETVASVLDLLRPLGNVTTIERPTRMRALVSVVRAALRARERQYDARALLVRLADADAKKDAFIAMLGHELRNPLAAIHGASTLLSAIPEPSERHRMCAEIIARQSRHLERLVDDLLDVARITAGKIMLKPRLMDLRDTARHVTNTLADAVRQQHHRLELELAADAVLVSADPVRVEQIVTNLVHNAIKYTPDGGAIRVAVDADDCCARVRVVDSGNGLTPESLDRIFEPFAQIDSSLDRSAGGLGLGLPLVRGLARLHGGRAAARSEGLGRGSEFIVTLPLAEPRATADDARASGALARTQNWRVLLVDDFPDTLHVLRMRLEELGCVVDTACDGEGALAKATSGAYDVAFMDIGLPKMDGYEVAHRLREDARTKALPLIAMSGYGRDEDKERSAASGFDRHLVKPVDAHTLLAEADALVRERSGGR